MGAGSEVIRGSSLVSVTFTLGKSMGADSRASRAPAPSMLGDELPLSH